jgi:Mg2+-importing ATPase
MMARTVLGLVIFLIVVGVFTHRNPLQSLLFAVALAVGLTPEFLPMIVSVTLSKGARAMAREKVIVKHLSAIQNFGSIDVLCSDKTGTITSGNMTRAGIEPGDVAGKTQQPLRNRNSQPPRHCHSEKPGNDRRGRLSKERRNPV